MGLLGFCVCLWLVTDMHTSPGIAPGGCNVMARTATAFTKGLSLDNPTLESSGTTDNLDKQYDTVSSNASGAIAFIFLSVAHSSHTSPWRDVDDANNKARNAKQQFVSN